MTLAFGDVNSKLLDAVGAADVDAEDRADDSLVEILKLKFGWDFGRDSGAEFQSLLTRFQQILPLLSQRPPIHRAVKKVLHT